MGDSAIGGGLVEAAELKALSRVQVGELGRLDGGIKTRGRNSESLLSSRWNRSVADVDDQGWMGDVVPLGSVELGRMSTSPGAMVVAMPDTEACAIGAEAASADESTVNVTASLTWPDGGSGAGGV